jgi:hypothetical protein
MYQLSIRPKLVEIASKALDRLSASVTLVLEKHFKSAICSIVGVTMSNQPVIFGTDTEIFLKIVEGFIWLVQDVEYCDVTAEFGGAMG